ncbi:MAG: YciI family protein [Gemmatimonas sp.]
MPDDPANDAKARAAAIQASLSREQCYVLMMRPNPDAPPMPRPAEEMRIVHHEYLLDLERRGVLFGAGPFVDETGNRVGAGMIIIRAANRSEAESIGLAEPYTAAGQRLMEFIPWQRNEGSVRINLRFADGVLEVDRRTYRLVKTDQDRTPGK